jgi:hypothetical protein
MSPHQLLWNPITGSAVTAAARATQATTPLRHQEA